MIKTALVVEDCPMTCKMTTFFLKKMGIENVVTIANSNEFENFCSSEHTDLDLVITDWNIDNNLDGGKVIDKMKQLNIPIAVVSSEDKETFESKVLSHSSNAPCFSKPLNSNEFKDWLLQFV